MKYLLATIVLVICLYGAYQFGKNRQALAPEITRIENYAFVREIAELATLEANGSSTIKSTNIKNDGTWTDALKKTLMEQSISVTIPYTAKYGVNLQDSALKIRRTDSVIRIHLPEPKLLSFELRLDRLEATNKKGWLLGEDDDRYTALQKQLYQDSRSQMEGNQVYLQRSRNKVASILQNYFATLGQTAVVTFDVGKVKTPE